MPKLAIWPRFTWDCWPPMQCANLSFQLSTCHIFNLKNVLSILFHWSQSSFNEVMHSSKAQYWHKTMDKEYDSLMKNSKWNLVSLLTMLKMVKFKWVYKIKTHFDATIDHDKAWLVAKGYIQQYGIDYDQTYFLVIKHDSIWAIFSLNATHDMNIMQYDVKSTYGDLQDEIYM
jgi:hypothetical protein